MERDAGHVRAVHLHLDRDGELVLAGPQRAGLVGQHLRQHRLHRARHVHARAAAERLALEPSTRPDVGGHVGDVHPEPHAAVLAAGRDGVVEVLGVVWVDRERGQVAQVHARVRGVRLVERGLRLAWLPAGKRRSPRSSISPSTTSRARSGRPSRRSTRAPRLPAPTSTRSPALGVAAFDRGPRSRPEERLRYQEAAALLEHGHHRLVQPAAGRASGGGAHRSLSNQRVERHGQRLVAVGVRVVAARTCGLMPLVEMVSPLGR